MAEDAREQLGPRLKKQFRDIKKQLAKTKSQIMSTGLSDDYLRQQWALQKEAQLTLDSRKWCIRSLLLIANGTLGRPSNLNKKLDKLQEIQAKIDEIEVQQEKGVKSAKIPSRAGRPRMRTRNAHDGLEAKRMDLVAKQEDLYTSIHVQFEGAYPLFKGLAPDFRAILIKALVLKFDIRRQAIQILFDHDRLDQSAAGKNPVLGMPLFIPLLYPTNSSYAWMVLGTKAHQTIRNTISTSSPILKRHIKTYNEYCNRLSELHDPQSWKTPLPQELPTTIQELRSGHSTLWQDAEWDLAGDRKAPAWMEDPETRRGIHALLQFDRCSEEMERLPLESDNMLRWFCSELLATDIAIRLPQSRSLVWFAV